MFRGPRILGWLAMLLACTAGSGCSAGPADGSSGFRLDGHGPVGPVPIDRVPLDLHWQLSFSDPFDVASLREHVVIEPSPASGSLLVEPWGPSRARLRARLAPGVAYLLSVRDGFTVLGGHRPSEPIEVRFVATDLAPRLELPTGLVLTPSRAPRVPLTVSNVAEIDLRVWRFEAPEDFERALAMGERADCAAHGLDASAGGEAQAVLSTEPLNRVAHLEPSLGGAVGPLCVELSAKGRGGRAAGGLRAATLVQSTDLALTAKLSPGQVLVWVTRLSDATAVGNAVVTLRRDSGVAVTAGRPDADGVARLTAAGIESSAAVPEPFILSAELELDSDADVAQYDRAWLRLIDERLARAPDLGAPGEAVESEPLRAVFFTDRGRYGPGEVVHLGVILGPGQAADPKSVSVVVLAPGGRVLLAEDRRLDGFGAAAFDLQLEPNAVPGRYEVRVSQGERVLVRELWVVRATGGPIVAAAPAPVPVPDPDPDPSTPAIQPMNGDRGSPTPGQLHREPLSSARFTPHRIALVADRSSYAPGDVARVRVDTSHGKARGLLTLERGGVLEHSTFVVAGEAPVLEISIDADSAPNLWVSALVVAGSGSPSTDVNAIGFEIGYVNLSVDPELQRLGVALQLDRISANPGETVTLSLFLSDSNGALKPGKVMLMVRGSGRGQSPAAVIDPVAQLYAERPPGVWLAESRLGLSCARPGQRPAGGDDSKSPAVEAVLDPEMKLDAEVPLARTVLWRPEILVGARGRAEVALVAPDAPAQYRIVAVAVDADGRVGAGEVWWRVGP